jgi:hypothetical protein
MLHLIAFVDGHKSVRIALQLLLGANLPVNNTTNDRKLEYARHIENSITSMQFKPGDLAAIVTASLFAGSSLRICAISSTRKALGAK